MTSTGDWEYWEAFDTRTGEVVSSSAAGFDLASAKETLQEWRDRDAKGGRPDLHEMTPFLDVRKRLALPDEGV